MPQSWMARSLFRLAAVTSFFALCSMAWTTLARAGDDAPPDLSGEYSFTGTMPDSTDCSGTFVIKKRMTVSPHDGPQYNSYDIKMKYNAGWKGMGVGTFIDGHFNFAVAKDTKYLAVVTYRPMVLSPYMQDLKQKLKDKQASRPGGMLQFHVADDPWWADAWTYKHYGVFFRADGSWGFENLGPEHLGDTPALGDGTWRFVRHYYDNKGKRDILDYRSGEVTAAVKGDAVEVQLSYTNDRGKLGEPVMNSGLMPEPNMLVAVFNGEGDEAVGSCKPSGLTMTGLICDAKDLALTSITLTVPEDTAKRNPGLFH